MAWPSLPAVDPGRWQQLDPVKFTVFEELSAATLPDGAPALKAFKAVFQAEHYTARPGPEGRRTPNGTFSARRDGGGGGHRLPLNPWRHTGRAKRRPPRTKLFRWDCRNSHF